MENRADNVRAFLWAVALHVLCGLLAFSGLFWWQTSKPVQAAGDPIEAVFVEIGDLAPPTAAARPPQPRPQPQPTPPAAPPPPAPPATDRAAEDRIERERIEREGQLLAEQQAREQEEQRRRAEQILLEEEEQRRQEEEQRRQREERERQQREEQQRQERERAERQAREQAEREAQERAEREAAERARQAGSGGADTGLAAQYASAIQRLVTSHWRRPETTPPGIVCVVRIIQIPGGEVLSATVASPCNADEPTRRSIEAAVLRAQPLPYTGFESVFDREIRFTFRYGG